MKFKNKLPESIESKFSKLAREKNNNRRKIYSLGLGEPYFETPTSISNMAFKSIKKGNTRYSDSRGTLDLRKKLSIKYNKKYNISSNVNNYLITSGSKMALFLTLKSILFPKDNIININPCYPSYLPQIILAQPNAKIVQLDLNNDFSLNVRSLKKSFKKKIKAIIINSPNNPTGKIYSNEELQIIFNLVKKNQSWLILDLIYEDLNYLNKKLNYFSKIFKYNKLVVVSGFSKSYAMTGWRIGYIYTKNKLINYMNKLNQHIITNVPVFIQDASLEALKNQKNSINEFKLVLRKNYEYFIEKLDVYKFDLPNIVGGMFLLINISNFNLKSDQFCEELLKKHKVAATPGIFFGKNWDRYIRVSLSCDHLEFKKAINKLSIFIESIRKN